MKRHLALLLALTLCLAVTSQAADDTTDIQRFLTAYDEAFNA